MSKIKYQLLSTTIAAIGFSSLGNMSNIAYSNSTNTGNVQFACSQSYNQERTEYVFTTFAWNPVNKKPLIVWKSEDMTSQGFNPQKRCELVSPRFQQAYDNGTLKFMREGEFNNQSVICTVSNIGDSCDTGTLLLTLSPEENPEQTLAQLSDILLGYGDSALQQNSEDKIHREEDAIYVDVDIEAFLND